VEKVEPGSPAARAGVRAGERLLAINGQPLRDLLDYRWAAAEPDPLLEVEGPWGHREVTVRKDWDEDLGLVFSVDSFDGLRRCRNRCLFCYVDQLPAGLRPSLYVKDDDYRYSVLYGNFVTLTNLTDRDWRRLLALRPSPLYVSVHTVDPVRRALLLGLAEAERADVRPPLLRLARAGIELHCQVVLCRHLNDAAFLEETLRFLASLWPQVRSVAVVPVGLTRYRQRLFPLVPFDAASAVAVLNQVHRRQHEFLRRLGSRLVFAADEFYHLSGWPFPPAEEYEGFPQLENGVGLVADFRAEWEEELRQLSYRPERGRPVMLVTGRAAAAVWLPLLAGLRRRRPGLRIELLPVTNRFFGPSVSAAGLLTGGDVVRALAPLRSRLRREGTVVFLPRVALREGSLFLDGYRLEDLQRELGVEVVAVEPRAGALLRQLEVVVWEDR